jgi:hypothetical protein
MKEDRLRSALSRAASRLRGGVSGQRSRQQEWPTAFGSALREVVKSVCSLEGDLLALRRFSELPRLNQACRETIFDDLAVPVRLILTPSDGSLKQETTIISSSPAWKRG